MLHGFPVCSLGLVLVFRESFSVLQWPNPISRVQVKHPYANQHPTRGPLTRWICVRLKIASCMSNLLARTFDFRNYTRCLPRMIWNLQDHTQNLNLEITPICTHLQRCSFHIAARNCSCSMWGLPMRARWRQFRKIREQTAAISSSSFLNLWSSIQGVENP